MSNCSRPIEHFFDVSLVTQAVEPEFVPVRSGTTGKTKRMQAVLVFTDQHPIRPRKGVRTFQTSKDKEDEREWNEDVYSHSLARFSERTEEPFRSGKDEYLYYKKGDTRRIRLIPARATECNGVKGGELAMAKKHQLAHMHRILGLPQHPVFSKKDMKLNALFHEQFIQRFRVVQVCTLSSYITRALASFDLPVDVYLILIGWCVADPIFWKIQQLCARTVLRVLAARERSLNVTV
jgi:hypothetical protein